MEVIYALQDYPKTQTKTIFLAGPTPRSQEVHSWRPDAIEILKKLKYDGQVYIPEPQDGNWRGHYDDQVEWEEVGLNRADIIVFWIPRSNDMPGYTTNDEWGFWKQTGKAVLGFPKDAEKMRYQEYYANKYHLSVSHTLEDTLKAALNLIGKGAARSAGEVYVPLYIWRTSSFQNWYGNMKLAGNRLDKARVLHSFYKAAYDNKQAHAKVEGTHDVFVYLWVMHVEVWIAKENRSKVNEIILSRTDTSAVVLYRKRATLADTEIVLVKEFRSAVSNKEGYVFELPSGSMSTDEACDPSESAIAEVEEETGLKMDKKRIEQQKSRQMAATFACHKCHVFSAELTEDELNAFKKEGGKIAHGIIEHSERTFLIVKTVRELFADNLTDWSVFGMIMSVINPLFTPALKQM